MSDRQAPGVWRYFSLNGMREKGATAVTWFRNSNVNGAVAIFRNIAGVPMEREPPAAL